MWKTASMLIAAVLMLLTVGIVMLASTSGAQAEAQYSDALFYVRRQVIWLFLGAVAATVMSRFNYHYLKPLALPLAVFCWILLIMALIPGVGLSVKGSSRWLRLGPVSLQPSELAKFSTVVLLAWWLSRIQRRVREFRKGLLIPLAGLSFTLLLIFIEPDFGTTLLIGAVGLAMMFVAGVRISYLLIVSLLGFTGFFFAVMKDAERMRRIIAFLNPEKYARDEAFQLLNAIYAFVVGGAAGAGLGQSVQKRFYLPEAHTDFIFAIIGEELGMAASLGVLIVYGIIFGCGLWISCRASDIFGRLLSFGLTMLIVLQAVINIGVVTGCLPTKGLPLPFISFGGSSLVVSMAMIGVLVNIARNAGGEELEVSVKDAAHRF